MKMRMEDKESREINLKVFRQADKLKKEEKKKEEILYLRKKKKCTNHATKYTLILIHATNIYKF